MAIAIQTLADLTRFSTKAWSETGLGGSNVVTVEAFRSMRHASEVVFPSIVTFHKPPHTSAISRRRRIVDRVAAAAGVLRIRRQSPES